MSADLLIYLVHGAFWGSFGLAGWLVERRFRSQPDASPAGPAAASEVTAPFSRAVLVLHTLAFGVLYFGLGNSVIPDRVPHWFLGQQLAGTVLIGLGAGLMSWARVWFRSWRFRAKIAAGHELATGGPFRILRHPIYMGLNLLALGSAVWAPTAITWCAVGLMLLGSDLRARAEERILLASFGEAYAEYCRRTARFLPGIY